MHPDITSVPVISRQLVTPDTKGLMRAAAHFGREWHTTCPKVRAVRRPFQLVLNRSSNCEALMMLKTWRFLTIMVLALALSAPLAHVMELPGKMTYDAPLYVMLHRTLYPTFGQTAGWAEGFALLSVIGLAWSVRKRGAAFPLTVLAAVCQAAAMAVFLVLVQPVNRTMGAWPLDAIPGDWTQWREQWEYG